MPHHQATEHNHITNTANKSLKTVAVLRYLGKREVKS